MQKMKLDLINQHLFILDRLVNIYLVILITSASFE